MTIEEIVAREATFAERARMIRAHDPTLSYGSIAKLLGCGSTTVSDAFKPRDEVSRRKHPQKIPVTRVTVEQRDDGWCVLLNGKLWSRHMTDDVAEDEAEWLRWPKTEKGKAA